MKDLRAIIIVCATLLVVTLIGSVTYLNRAPTSNIISVTGKGSVDFTSDRVIWKGDFSERDMQLKSAYAKINKSRATVEAYLKEKGVKAEELTFSPLSIENRYTDVLNLEGAKIGTKFEGYELTLSFVVDSHDVGRIGEISRDCGTLIDQGVALISGEPSYYFTKLSDLKLKLVALATQDGKARAAAIATNSGAQLGRITSTSLGVFQIISSTDSPEASSWDGIFDTSSLNKTATVTVHAEYEVK